MSRLTENDLVELVRLKEQEGLSYRGMAKVMGVEVTAVGNFFRKTTHVEFWESHGHKPIAGGTTNRPVSKRKKLTGKRFIFGHVQNNTHIHGAFMQTLKHFMKDMDAELILGSCTYAKSGHRRECDGNTWFDPKIREYIRNEQLQVCDGLVFCGELNILPTAKTPLNQYHSYTGTDSMIMPHTKLQIAPGIRLPTNDPKFLFTTGALTQSNYIQKSAGQQAEYDHVFSVLYIEIDKEGDWFPYHLSAESDTGCFYHLNKRYTPQGCDGKFYPLAGLNPGDVHEDKLKMPIRKMMWLDDDSLIRTLKPEVVMANDTYDHGRRNSHNVDDPYHMYRAYVKGKECVKEEITGSVDTLREITDTGSKVVVVESNHDLQVERWLRTANYKTDPVNAVFFLELQLCNYQRMSRGEKLHTFRSACEIVNGGELYNVIFLTTDESFTVAGIQCGMHGDKGINGARGSIPSLAKLGVKTNTGHIHSAYVLNGAWAAGALMTQSDSGYAKGLTTWGITHIGTYQNGKRVMLVCKNNKWQPRYDV